MRTLMLAALLCAIPSQALAQPHHMKHKMTYPRTRKPLQPKREAHKDIIEVVKA